MKFLCLSYPPENYERWIPCSEVKEFKIFTERVEGISTNYIVIALNSDELIHATCIGELKDFVKNEKNKIVHFDVWKKHKTDAFWIDFGKTLLGDDN